MAAREVIHSGLEAQPLLHARFSAFASPERVAPHLKTQHVLFPPASDGPRNHEHPRVLTSDAHADTDADNFGPAVDR